MKLGVLTNVVGNMPLEDALKYFKSMGIQTVSYTHLLSRFVKTVMTCLWIFLQSMLMQVAS